jgi:hypothetical protein
MSIDPGSGRRMHRALAALAIAGLVLSLGIVAPAAEANSTAKGAVQEATAAGRKWQADAVLTHISTLVAKPDGKARSWLYTFHSPKARKSAIVTAGGGAIDVTADVRNTSVDPIGAQYLDSDKAMEAARKLGLQVDGDAAMGLTQGGQATGRATLFWTVTVFKGDGMSAVTMDGRDGALIRRDDVKLK